MRASRWSLPLLLALAWVGCRTAAPGRVIQFTPGRDEVSDSDLARGLRITFDRPVGPERAGPAGAAFVISPPLDGEARWLDRKTLAFFPRGKPQESTAYRVALDPRLVTAPQARLVPWGGARFVFRRMTIQDATLDGPAQFQGRTPVVTVRASRPVRQADAVAACAFFESRGGQRGQAIAAREVEIALATTTLVRLRPATELSPGT